MWIIAAAARPADAGTLISIKLGTVGTQSVRAVMTFANGMPSYAVLGNDTSDVSVILQGTLRGGDGSPTPSTGLLKSITAAPLGTNLNVTFHTAGPAEVSLAPGTGQTLLVTVRAIGNTTAAPPQGIVSSPPPATFSPRAEDTTVIVQLKYADVSEVVGLLAGGQQIASNDMFTPQEQQFGSSGLPGGTTGGFLGASLGGVNTQPAQLTPQPQNPALTGSSLGQQINEHIGVDRRLNAIILTGSPAQIARYKAAIAIIDVPLSSVELEVQIVELDDNAAKDIGIDFTNAGGALAAATYGIKSLTTGQGAIALQAAVYAQIQEGHGRTIARPRITALDGTTAQIITGTQIPIVTSIAVSGVSAVSSQVQYINVGVSLQIQPRISSDGFVTSHIFSQVSSQTGTVQSYPELSQREASTTATVRDGDSFVIGGLLQQNEISSLAKVPGLGSLPLIGGFFRVRHDSSQHTNLYIVVTPHVLKNGSNPPLQTQR